MQNGRRTEPNMTVKCFFSPLVTIRKFYANYDTRLLPLLVLLLLRRRHQSHTIDNNTK